MKKSRFKYERRRVKVDQRGAIYSLALEIGATIVAGIIFMWLYFHDRQPIEIALGASLLEWIVLTIIAYRWFKKWVKEG